MLRGGQIIVPDFGDMTDDVIRELETGAQFQHVQIAKEQREIARLEQYNDRRFMKFGRLQMRVTEEAYHYWGQRLGYKIWNNSEWRREYERDNPEVRVKSRPRAVTIRVPRTVEGGGPSAPGARSAPAARGVAVPRGTILDRTGCVVGKEPAAPSPVALRATGEAHAGKPRGVCRPTLN